MAVEKIGPIEVETTDEIGVVTLRRAGDIIAEELVLDRTEWNQLKQLFHDGKLDHI